MDAGGIWTPAFTLPADDWGSQFTPEAIHVDRLDCDNSAVWVSFTGPLAGTERTPYVVYRGTADGRWTAVMKAAGHGPPTVAAPPGGTYPAPLTVLSSDSAVAAVYTPSASPPVVLSSLTVMADGSLLGPPWPVPGVLTVTALSFPSPAHGWVLGPKFGTTNADAVLATADGGRTWREQLVRGVPPPGG